jgi:Ser/Thr protein kinase RdoA (MazF antagonist)
LSDENGDTQRVFDTLRQAYDLGEWVDWRRAESGSSDIFVTTTRGRYVVRESHDGKTEAGMRFEVRLLDFLQASGYPAPPVVATRKGEPYHVDGAFYLVTEVIPGTPYDPDNPAHLRAAGWALARYHLTVRAFSERFRTQPRPLLVTLEHLGPATLAEFGEVAAAFLSPEESKRLSRALSRLWIQYVRVPEALAGVVPNLPQMVIQGSFGRSALVYDNDRVAGVVDYHRASYELRALDLAYTVKAFARVEDPASPHFRVGLDFARCALFTTAYAEVEDLPPDEVAALPLVFRSQRLVKVLSKTRNFLSEHERQPQVEKDVLEVVAIIECEADRLRWLEEHEKDLLLAMGGAALV